MFDGTIVSTFLQKTFCLTIRYVNGEYYIAAIEPRVRERARGEDSSKCHWDRLAVVDAQEASKYHAQGASGS